MALTELVASIACQDAGIALSLLANPYWLSTHQLPHVPTPRAFGSGGKFPICKTILVRIQMQACCGWQQPTGK